MKSEPEERRSEVRAKIASLLSISRTDPQQRLLVLTFGGLAVFLVTIGLSIAFVLQARIEQRSTQLAATFVTNDLRGHLEHRTIDGSLTATAATPSDRAWWHHFREDLLTMVSALDLDVLDSNGTILFSDGGAGELGMRHIPSQALRRLRRGQPTHYVRTSHTSPDTTVLVVALPVTFLHEDGSVEGTGAVSVEIDAQPLLATSNEVRNIAFFTTVAILVVLLATLWALTRRLSKRAFRDTLTNLPNRKYFTESATATLAHNQRHDRPCALLYADINRLGEVNTTLGQRAGDAVLLSVARALTKRTRAGDTVARIGGDDFGILLNEASIEEARIVADNIATTLETATALDSQRVRISLSIGVSAFPQDGTTIDELLQHAEAAMRIAKAQQLPFATADTKEPRATGETLGLEADLRDALLRDGLDVHYQPIVRASDGTIASYEALARWNHPSGPISPGTFIPIAENTGLIRNLDRYVYRSAVQLIASTLESRTDLRVSVNLSAASIADPTTAAYLIHTAEQHAVPSNRITVEVTETAAIQNLRNATESLSGLRKHGFRVALDDFGTGFSSLAYLRQLPIDIVKIDRAFITGIGHEPSDEMLVQAVINYAHSLLLRTVAEGVETTDQHTWLLDKGIDFEQGFFHGKPGPLAPASDMP